MHCTSHDVRVIYMILLKSCSVAILKKKKKKKKLAGWTLSEIFFPRNLKLNFDLFQNKIQFIIHL